jgi:hypothetical protein
MIRLISAAGRIRHRLFGHRPKFQETEIVAAALAPTHPLSLRREDDRRNNMEDMITARPQRFENDGQCLGCSGVNVVKQKDAFSLRREQSRRAIESNSWRQAIARAIEWREHENVRYAREMCATAKNLA